MTTAGPPDITPNPSIHNVPPDDSGIPTPADWGQLEAWGQQLLYFCAQAVAEALLNITIFGISPYEVLQEFGSDPAGIISTVIAALGGSGSGTSGLTSVLENIPQANIVGLVTALEGVISGATWQTFLNDIYAALGGSGTATVADIATALAAIPEGNIAGLSSSLSALLSITTFQSLLDGIANAMGQSGAGHTVSQVQSYLEAIPADVITGALTSAVTVAGASDMQALIGTVVGTEENVLPITLPFTIGAPTTMDDLADYINTLAPQESLQELQDVLYNGVSGNAQINWVTGTTKAQLARALAQAQATASAAQDMAQQALSLVNALLYDVESLTLPNVNVSGLLGASTVGTGGLGGQLQALIDAGVQGLNSVETVGNSIAQFASAASGIASLLGWNPSGPAPQNSVSAVTQTNNAFIAAMASAKPNYTTLLMGADVTFPIQNVITNTSAPTIGVTQTSSVIGFVTTHTGGIKESIGWLGGSYTNISSIVVNIYQVDTSTNNGSLSFIATSGNLMSVGTGIVSNPTPEWTYWNLSATNTPFIDAAQGNVYAIEFQVLGAGSYNIVGVQNQWLPPHPTAVPNFWAATRTTLTAPQLTEIGAGGGNDYHGTGVNPWNHTFGANDTCLIIFSSYWGVNEGLSFTVGSTSVTNIGGPGQYYADPGVQGIACNVYGIIIPTSMQGTTQPISASGSGTVSGWVAQSFSFSGVSGFGTVQDTYANGGNQMYHQVTAAVNELIAQSFLTTANPGVFGGNNTYTGDLIYQYTADGDELNFEVGTAPGAASVTFADTITFTSSFYTSEWNSIAVPLIGVVPPAPQYIAAPTQSNYVPYLELAGSAGITQYAPELTPFTNAGTFTYTIPSWMTTGDQFDIVILGAGGAGSSADFNVTGNGGYGGSWSAVTLTYGVDVPISTTTFSVSVGSGGLSPAPGGNPGYAGGGSSVSIVGYASSPLSAGGGAGASGIGGNSAGLSPGNETFNGETYYGGGQQVSPATGYGPNGYSPGGGGSGGHGGNASLPGGFPGGGGANGAVWVLAYQNTG